MSNTTLHPASQNFRVEMSDECASCGTICASVILSGSHGISRWHVCDDCMILPSGSLMLRGLVATFFRVTGAPSTTKCAVAPESEYAYSTCLVTRGLLNMVSAIGNSWRLFICTIRSHALLLLFGALLVALCGRGNTLLLVSWGSFDIITALSTGFLGRVSS